MIIGKNNAVRFAAALIAAVYASALHAEYNEIDTDFPMTGPTDFIAEAGVTNVYTGLISGTGPAVIKGGGTVAFSHANNTYICGTLISNAVFRLDADGCAGSGAITGAVNKAHVFINCANVPNDLRFNDTYFNSSYMSPGAYPADKVNPLLPLRSNVTVVGNVYFADTPILYDSTNPAMVSPLPKVTYKKGISVRNTTSCSIYLCPQGRMIFEGPFKGSPKNTWGSELGYKSSARGTMEFHASSNELACAVLYNANLDFRAVDAFPETVFYYQDCGNDYCKMFLNGNDQTILGICMKSSLTPGETAKGMCITSDEPATVRIKGYAKSRIRGSLVNKLALFGNVSLVMDVDSTYTSDGFFQDFSVRKSTTTGDLTISNGDFRVSGTASFPNVPNIYVGTGGSFTNASTRSGAFAGCTNLTVLGSMACTGDATPFGTKLNLTLGADSSFSLPAGATATILSLRVGDTNMPEGSYGDGGTPIAQIKQGTIVVRSLDRYVDCVNGSDLNDGAYGRPHKTIRAATDNAMSGNIIHVAPGTYGAEEGSQKWPDETSEIGTRVVIPDGVTLVSTEGAEKTFIVGAASPEPAVTEGWLAGIGPGAVRCVRAGDGAVLRGFTLTGGYTHARTASLEQDGYASAFYSSSQKATIEDCIVSNNVACLYTINEAVVRRCRVIGNTAAAADDSGYSGAAGVSCAWYSSIIANNRGNVTVGNPVAFESCTIGRGNVCDGVGHASQVVYWWDGKSHAIFNSAILEGRYYCLLPGKICFANCLVMAENINSAVSVERSYNTIITNSTAAKVDSEYRPILGEFVGIDKGDTAFSTAALGDTDVLGTPRVLNGAIDIGAVEYDWRPTFSAVGGSPFFEA